MPQLSEIKATRDRLHQKNCDVRIPNTTIPCLEDCINECYKNIRECEEVLVITKPDGSVGESVMHEICFAMYFHKRFILHKSY